MDSRQHTTDPIVTGSFVIGLKYNGGVLLGADCLASYGSLARFREIERLKAIGKHTVIGASGEYSDFQFLTRKLEEIDRQDSFTGSAITTEKSPSAFHSYVSRLMYNKRNKFDPLYNSVLVAGYSDGSAFLGMADHHGTSFVDDAIATGFGNHLAMPLLRKILEERPASTLPYEDAVEVMKTCFRVLFYRDGRTMNKFQIARVNADGTDISESFSLDTEWQFRGF
uniref:Proteasome subunit beta n=1 Tax=Stygiella incarcerata TaxID=1712417 RepID=A0A192ZIE1_9EUKA|nr:proteasome subunit beta type-4 [Stygiella incarcerata]|eukprot:TRINITY_DN69402_c0_g1_i1.p1 TRINITY_DN69402_c0_g1~~TRINITY_DN69402_c0_g1_i1.p1  ORF type:complete len:225 (+),score=52.93 TRINITY_DN69402_c0_g1_i1:168-842(+)